MSKAPLTFKVAERDAGSFAAYDDAGVLQADERDVEADTHADGLLQAQRYGIHYHLPDVGQGQDDEEEAFNEHRGERELPGISHGKADGEHEEGVESHAGSKAERLLRIKGHHEGTDDGGEGGGGEDR